MRLIPLDFMGAGRNFYLIRRKSHPLSPVMKAFIKTLKNIPADDR
jgi:DNA-binding transcriptional LysR family regulator